MYTTSTTWPAHETPTSGGTYGDIRYSATPTTANTSHYPHIPNTANFDTTSYSTYPTMADSSLHNKDIATFSDTPSHYETKTSTEGIDVKASDPHLVSHYQFLMRATEFKRLDRAARSHWPLILLDSSRMPDQPIDYDYGLHQIRIPLYKKDMRTLRADVEVRTDILWEMRNASNADTLRQLEDLVPPEPAPNASKQEKKNYQYKKAIRALAAEWFEWASIKEHDCRCQLINEDQNMGNNGGDHVKRQYKNLIKSWEYFDNYLTRQIESGHTASYDPAASNVDWIGKKIVAQIANSNARKSLRISETATKDWQNGKRPNIINLSNNPFLSHAGGDAPRLASTGDSAYYAPNTIPNSSSNQDRVGEYINGVWYGN